MEAVITHKEREYLVDLAKPLDISLSLRGDEKNPRAWNLQAPQIQPVKMGDWVGKVSRGASINFNDIYFNPHGHTTHTECVGHITREFYSINDHLKQYFYLTKVVSITPQRREADHIITLDQVQQVLGKGEVESIVIRTLPNSVAKRSKQYSNTNWPYLEEAAAGYLRDCGIKHLLIDLPSIDKEEDGGALVAHKAFWNYPKNIRFEATITEMIYVPAKVEDGKYFLSLQPASFENDAAPSKPVLYKIQSS